eukprot:6410741-Prymnesium_polylepis.1
MLPVRCRTPRCDVRSRMRPVWRRRHQKVMSGVRRWFVGDNFSVDAMQHNNIRHRDESSRRSWTIYCGARPWHTEITQSALSTHIGSKT